MNEPFTPKQLVDFFVFKEIRDSGEYNMLSRQAIEATDLSRNDYMFVISNFDALDKAVHKVPQPPDGYTAEELERDNPHNAWMNDHGTDTTV